MNTVSPKIRAEVHGDDFAYTAKFDASPWFQIATQEEIVALAAIDWGGDYAADEVARFFEVRPGYDDVGDVFNDAARRKTGFECHVHDGDAKIWLNEFRPDVFAAVCKAVDADPGEEASLRLDAPFWDRDSSWSGDYNLPPDTASPSVAP